MSVEEHQTGAAAPTVTTIALDQVGTLVDLWRDLVARALEPNVMHGPDVLVPALSTFAARDARLLVAHRRHGNATRLVGLLPLWRPRLGFGLLGRLPTLFSNEFSPLGTPLIDAERPGEILEALLTAASRLGPGLVFTHLGLDGAVAGALRAAAAIRGDRLFVAERQERAALVAGSDGRTGETGFEAGIRRHRRREWRRQWRRLLETGPITTATVRGPAARAAFADFLVLEASGWKGRRGTALVQNPAERRFAESIVDALADRDGVVIDRIDRSGQPIAMLVNFGVAGRHVTWKTAYDEAFSAFSPGAQVFLYASHRFLDEPHVILVDSLAVTEHPLLTHMWRDSRVFGTMIVGFAGSTLRPRGLAAEIGLHAHLRRSARRLRDRVRLG